MNRRTPFRMILASVARNAFSQTAHLFSFCPSLPPIVPHTFSPSLPLPPPPSLPPSVPPFPPPFPSLPSLHSLFPPMTSIPLFSPPLPLSLYRLPSSLTPSRSWSRERERERERERRSGTLLLSHSLFPSLFLLCQVIVLLPPSTPSI